MSAKDFIKYGDGYADIELAKGVKIDGTLVKTVRMREPTVLDQRAAQKSGASQADMEPTLFANLCDVLPDDVDAMSMRDYGRVQAAYLGFID